MVYPPQNNMPGPGGLDPFGRLGPPMYRVPTFEESRYMRRIEAAMKCPNKCPDPPAVFANNPAFGTPNEKAIPSVSLCFNCLCTWRTSGEGKMLSRRQPKLEDVPIKEVP